MKSMIRTYSELIRLQTFEERIRYLQVTAPPTMETFGSFRYLNQCFYTSITWKRIRDKVIIRDNGFDLALEGYPLIDRIIVHHLNPIRPDQLMRGDPCLLDMENLVSTCHSTHQLIHYSTDIPRETIRVPNDTCPWR